MNLLFSSEQYFRELRLSDIGDLKRAVLFKKTQRSFSLNSGGAGGSPNIESSQSRARASNENVPIKFQEDHISPARSDLNNNNSESNESQHNQSKVNRNQSAPLRCQDRISNLSLTYHDRLHFVVSSE